jgi:hypothetical protein
MRRYGWVLLAGILLLTGCKQKKKPSLSGDDPVEVGDFISFFEPARLPYEITDTALNRRINDSLLISYKVFTQFVPDSVLTRFFGKNERPKIYPLRRITAESGETYLFSKAVLADKKIAYVLCFDKKNKFAGSLKLLQPDASSATNQLSGMDRKYSIFKTTILRKPDGTAGEGREVYVFNAEAKQFMLIMTDALDDRVKEIINPIDTLPRKHRLSADYVRDKMNIVSVRDGNKPDKLIFFIHFESRDGVCSGELKGIATIINARTAVYRKSGDACVLQFNFTSSSVALKEVEPCGKYRGIKCTFDVFFPRKKEVRKAVKKKSSK